VSRGRTGLATLSTEQARSFYDRFGAKQDRQTFYEAPALGALVANSELQDAESVFEFGCGTGRLALELLQHHLPATASYVGIDISKTMIGIASGRLAPFRARASAALASGGPLPPPDASVDRFVSTYVLDLLPETLVQEVLLEARRVLRPGGLLCLAGITDGPTIPSRVVMGVWRRLFAMNPAWVGGCRPTVLTDHVSPTRWQTRFHDVVVAWGVASEVLIASPTVTDGKGDKAIR
jgi:ubiquinone/menaquinone biosynthesis C-methylase UbiE